MRTFAALAAVLCLVGSVAVADTFTASIVLPDGNLATPGVGLAVEIHGTLTNDSPGNEGLAFISVDFTMSGPDTINLGAALVMDEPGDGSMVNFTRDEGYDAGVGGTPVGDDVLQAGGAQNTIGNNPAAEPFLDFPSAEFISFGIALDDDQVVLEGTITFPIDAADGTYTLSLANVLANVISDGAVPGSFAIYPVEAADTASPDSADIILSACAAPFVSHIAEGVSFSENAFSTYIDPRLESNNGVDLNLGVDQVTFVFSTEVENLDGSALTADAFSIRETGAGSPPAITGIETKDNRIVTVLLAGPITLQEWTTIEAAVRSSCNGTPINNLGDLGEGFFEEDRIDIGFLPGDLNQTNGVQILDFLNFRQMLISGAFSNPLGVDEDYGDTDRNGEIQVFDLLRFRQIFLGTPPATQVWLGESMNFDQP